MVSGTLAHDASDASAHKLRERIKELQCLYAVARIAQHPELGLEAMLTAIVRTMPQGWQFPDELQVSLIVDDTEHGKPVNAMRTMQAPILIDKEPRGLLTVSYTDGTHTDAAELFLPEEQDLIDRLAAEVASIVERHEKREQRRKMEAHLRHNDRLMLLSELTAGIAHELNTPLGNVLGYAELLKKDEGDPARREDLQRIVDSAIIGREVVKKLMYFSCEMPSQFRLMDVHELIAGALRLVQRQCDERQVQVETRFAEALPAVRLDPVQFEQVIINLVLNAITAMPVSGKLRITTRTDAGNVHIAVADNGSGIAPDVLRKIFQPFFTTKPTGEGTGLGLSVVHGIMQGHNGTITVDSAPGQGTTFHLTFPAAA
ncbi:MAG: sensor histidine kinase [Flavobacteriales bacterium]|nr:sensor histidine kinase [Flavobacteriales bacterium]